MGIAINNPPSTIYSGFTDGSVVFAGLDGILSEDNANFFWDRTNLRLGINNNTPTSLVHIAKTTTLVGGDQALTSSITANPGAAGATYTGGLLSAVMAAANAQTVTGLTGGRIFVINNGTGATVTTMLGAQIQAIIGPVLAAASGTNAASNITSAIIQAVQNTNAVSTLATLVGLNCPVDARGTMPITTHLAGFFGVGVSNAGCTVTTMTAVRASTTSIAGANLCSAGTITNAIMMQVDAFPSAGMTYTNAPEQLRLPAASVANSIAIRQQGTTAHNRFNGFCKFGADSAPAVQMDIVGAITQITGAVSLSANAASSFTTSAGALTLTAAAASTWKTSAGALTVDAAAALNLGTVVSTSLTAGRNLAGYNVGIDADTTFIGNGSAATFIILGSGAAATNPGALQMSTGGYILYSNVPNGAGAVGFLIQTANTFSTAGAKLASFTNNATERFFFDKTGRSNFRGTALVAGDFVLGAGWGAGATVAVTAGNDSRFTIVITAGGAGRTANATMVFTFKDGAWAAAPFAQMAQIATSAAGELVDKITWTTTTTTLTMTYVPLPAAAGTHTITGMVIG